MTFLLVSGLRLIWVLAPPKCQVSRYCEIRPEVEPLCLLFCRALNRAAHSVWWLKLRKFVVTQAFVLLSYSVSLLRCVLCPTGLHTSVWWLMLRRLRSTTLLLVLLSS